MSIQQSTRKEINHDITPIAKQKLMYSSVTCNNKNSMNIIKPMNNMNINESHSQGFSALAALHSQEIACRNIAAAWAYTLNHLKMTKLDFSPFPGSSLQQQFRAISLLL